jgi:large conductance mechanosensitive channel
MLKEFRDFAMRGNVVDMAVGIILGVAFGKIVSSLVADIIMPPIGVLMGGVDFSEYYINLTSTAYESLAAAREAGAATINIGVFVNTVIDFVIVAFAIFMMIKQMNRLKKAPPPADPTTKDCPRCLMSVPIAATRCGHCTADI